MIILMALKRVLVVSNSCSLLLSGALLLWTSPVTDPLIRDYPSSWEWNDATSTTSFVVHVYVSVDGSGTSAHTGPGSAFLAKRPFSSRSARTRTWPNDVEWARTTEFISHLSNTCLLPSCWWPLLLYVHMWRRHECASDDPIHWASASRSHCRAGQSYAGDVQDRQWGCGWWFNGGGIALSQQLLSAEQVG